MLNIVKLLNLVYNWWMVDDGRLPSLEVCKNSALVFLHLRGQLAHAFRSTSQVEPLGWQGS